MPNYGGVPGEAQFKKEARLPRLPSWFFSTVAVGAMTIIAQDDHLTAGAWAACGLSSLKKTRSFVNIDLR